MTDAVGQILSLGVGVALSPIPVAVVLMLATPPTTRRSSRC
jgi:hypothetical protein